jgi:heme exporter protein CcmD
MTHATFIIASYAIAGLAVLGATVAIVLDYRRLKAALQKIGAPVDQREDEA